MRFLHFVLLFFTSLAAYPQIITTFAGTGMVGSSGNGGPAASAQLYDPQSVCADNAGNIYVADHGNHTVRKIDNTGLITIFAGNGTDGYSGDDGPASAAQLNYPYGVCCDNSGNIYITDDQAQVVRKVDITGKISTVAGTGTFGYSGDGGPATTAQLFAPCGICADNAGNIYFAEFGNQIIRKVSTTGIISTVAGIPGSLGYSGDGGPAILAQLNSPTCVSVDGAGNLYIADLGNCVIRKVDAAGIITTFAGGTGIGYSGDGGPATAAELKYPYFVYTDNNGNVYISDTGNGVIRVVNSSGIISTIAGNGTTGSSGDGGPATSAQLTTPGGICFDNAGNLYIADPGAHEIRKVGNCVAAVISLQPVGQSLCTAGNTGFTINATNVTSYQWQVNTGSGWINIMNDATYSGAASGTLQVTVASTAMNSYQYRCGVTNGCGTIFSSAAVLTVTTPSTPSVTITTISNTICAGNNVTFNATEINGGTTPLYQWKKNGSGTGTNSTTYSDNNLGDGDVITCMLTSNSNCITTNTAVSNAITMVVNPALTPSVAITASATSICYGTPVTFTAVETNGGAAPVFQWKKNGITVGTNSSSYTTNSLSNQEIITCMVTSSYPCATIPMSISNEIEVQVTPLVMPSLTITTTNTSICPGAAATFLAVPINAGVSPAWQWNKNGIPVGSNSDIYTANNIGDGDIINCTITSNAPCLAAPSAVSNSISMVVLKSPAVSLDKTATLCAGSSRQLDAGSYASYLWNNGSVERTLMVNGIGTYYVTVTDNNGCKGSDTVSINIIVPPPANFLRAGDSICSYGSLTLAPNNSYKNYLWSNNSAGPSITIDKPGLYWLEVTDNNNCTGRDSVLIPQKECLQGFYIPTAFTPNGDGKNDFFKPLIFGNIRSYQFIIYNRWGQRIFQGTDINKGWDGKVGGIQQDSDVFVWICSYQLSGGSPEVRRGSVMLIR